MVFEGVGEFFERVFGLHGVGGDEEEEVVGLFDAVLDGLGVVGAFLDVSVVGPGGDGVAGEGGEELVAGGLVLGVVADEGLGGEVFGVFAGFAEVFAEEEGGGIGGLLAVGVVRRRFRGGRWVGQRWVGCVL